MGRTYTVTPVQERMDRYTIPEPNSGCFLWFGHADKDGYGGITINGRQVRAHRVAWSLANKKDPGALMVLHTCDNPACVNPNHLYLGTHADNMRDETLRRRHASSKKTECNNGHPLAGDNLYMYPVRGKLARYCRACRAIHNKARSAKRGTK